jgi:hypothetical protein
MYYHTGTMQHDTFLVSVILSCSVLIGIPYYLMMKSYEYGASLLNDIRKYYYPSIEK